MRSHPIWIFLLGWLAGSFLGLQAIMGMVGGMGGKRQAA